MVNITKKNFIKYIKEIVSLKRDAEKLNDVLKNIDPDFGGLYLTRHETLLVEILQDAMNDENDWIGYFLYEMNCKFSKKPVGKENKKNLYIKNYNDLYKNL